MHRTVHAKILSLNKCPHEKSIKMYLIIVYHFAGNVSTFVWLKSEQRAFFIPSDFDSPLILQVGSIWQGCSGMTKNTLDLIDSDEPLPKPCCWSVPKLKLFHVFLQSTLELAFSVFFLVNFQVTCCIFNYFNLPKHEFKAKHIVINITCK